MNYNPLVFSGFDESGTSGGGTVTSVAGGVGITNTPEPIVGAGTVDLDIFSLTSLVASDAADWLPLVDVSVGTTPSAQRKILRSDLFGVELEALRAGIGVGLLARTGAGTYAARTLQPPAAGVTIANPAGTLGDPTFTLANDLLALEGLAATGIAVRTAADTWAQRTLQPPAAGLTIANPAGVAGDPTFALANDLAALEAMAGTGIVVRTAAETYAQRTLQQPAAGVTIANPAGIAGDPTFALANDLLALENLAATGIACRTAADTWAQRTLTQPAAGLTIANPAGVAGNPTFALANDLAALEALGNGIPSRTGADTWTNTTGAAGEILYYLNSTTPTSESDFTWDATRDLLKIDVASDSPVGDGGLLITDANPSKTSSHGRLYIAVDNTAVLAHFWRSGPDPEVLIRSSGGTIGSPTATGATDGLGRLTFGGCAGTSDSAGNIARGARIEAIAQGSFSGGTSYPTDLLFYTVPSGSTTLTERMRLFSTGNLGLGTATDIANVRLRVIGGSTECSEIYGTTTAAGGLLLKANTTDTDGRVNIQYRMSYGNQSGLTITALDDLCRAAYDAAVTVNGGTVNALVVGAPPTGAEIFGGNQYDSSLGFALAASTGAFGFCTLFNLQARIYADSTLTCGTTTAFANQPRFAINTAGITYTLADTGGIPGSCAVLHNPGFGRKSSLGSGTGVFTTVTGLYCAGEVRSMWSGDTWVGVKMIDPGSTGTITTVGCIDIGALTRGSTTTFGVRSAITANASRYFLLDTGGAQSSFVGKFTKYNNLTTAGAGMTSIIAVVDLTAQAATRTATALFTPPVAGFYRVSFHYTLTQAATTSSTLASGVNVNYSTGNGGTAVTQNVPMWIQGSTTATVDTGSTANVVGTTLIGSVVIYCNTTGVTFDATYASSGATPMQFAEHIRVEAL